MPSFTTKFSIFELFLSFLVIFIWYVFIFLFSAVTVTKHSFNPTLKSTLPNPITLDNSSSNSPSISTYVTSFSTSSSYNNVSLLNIGLIVYPLTYKSFKSTLLLSSLLTITVYVLILPVSAVTKIFIVFTPVLNDLYPSPVTVAFELSGIHSIIISFTLFYTSISYVLLSLSKTGVSIPILLVILLR